MSKTISADSTRRVLGRKVLQGIGKSNIYKIKHLVGQSDY